MWNKYDQKVIVCGVSMILGAIVYGISMKRIGVLRKKYVIRKHFVSRINNIKNSNFMQNSTYFVISRNC